MPWRQRRENVLSQTRRAPRKVSHERGPVLTRCWEAVASSQLNSVALNCTTDGHITLPVVCRSHQGRECQAVLETDIKSLLKDAFLVGPICRSQAHENVQVTVISSGASCP